MWTTGTLSTKPAWRPAPSQAFPSLLLMSAVPAAKPRFTWEGRCKQLIGQQLQVLQGDVTDGTDVEEAGEQVGQLGGKDAEQRQAAVQPGQRSLAAQQLSAKTRRGGH